MSQRVAAIPGIGPIIATAIAAAGAEQGPMGHFDRAGIRARDDTDPVISRNPQNLAG